MFLYSPLSPVSVNSFPEVAAFVSHVGDGKPLQHSVEVMEIALDQFGSPNDRRLALIDKNRDLFLAGVRLYGSQRKFVKLATMVRLLSST